MRRERFLDLGIFLQGLWRKSFFFIIFAHILHLGRVCTPPEIHVNYGKSAEVASFVRIILTEKGFSGCMPNGWQYISHRDIPRLDRYGKNKTVSFSRRDEVFKAEKTLSGKIIHQQSFETLCRNNQINIYFFLECKRW